MTLCASFCWKSLSRPFLYNLDSTPPQVINTATNDGEPGVGGQSPTSQDFAPIHRGLPELSASFRDRPNHPSTRSEAPTYSIRKTGSKGDFTEGRRGGAKFESPRPGILTGEAKRRDSAGGGRRVDSRASRARRLRIRTRLHSFFV